MTFASVLAALPPTLPATVVRDGSATVVAVGILDAIGPSTGDPGVFARLDGLEQGWWAGVASYDLGRLVERLAPRAADPDAVPDFHFVRFAARTELHDDGRVVHHGSGPERDALDRALTHSGPVGSVPVSPAWTSSLSRAAYEQRVGAIHELIRAGEAYQVNLTRRLTGPTIDPIALWAAVGSGNPAPHRAFWRDGGGLAVVSASPERFLALAGDEVETRPIKGTATRAQRLRASEKDQAENVMIVDLARNDLGRVCVPGSIAVPELCRIETHPGLVHLVSTVRGRLEPGTGLGTLLRATFPPASITGAPKPRVMQAIDDLEPVRRGLYCGTMGWIDADRRRADLAVTIRTFTCTPTATTFGVGAGITIDSDPRAEWAETELKAARLLMLAGERGEPLLASARP